MTYYITLTFFLRTMSSSPLHWNLLQRNIFNPINPLIRNNQRIDAVVAFKSLLLQIGLDGAIEFLKLERGDVVDGLFVGAAAFNLDKMENIPCHRDDIDLSETVVDVAVNDPQAAISQELAPALFGHIAFRAGMHGYSR